jgi:hypothetical protein
MCPDSVANNACSHSGSTPLHLLLHDNYGSAQISKERHQTMMQIVHLFVQACPRVLNVTTLMKERPIDICSAHPTTTHRLPCPFRDEIQRILSVYSIVYAFDPVALVHADPPTHTIFAHRPLAQIRETDT